MYLYDHCCRHRVPVRLLFIVASQLKSRMLTCQRGLQNSVRSSSACSIHPNRDAVSLHSSWGDQPKSLWMPSCASKRLYNSSSWYKWGASSAHSRLSSSFAATSSTSPYSNQTVEFHGLVKDIVFSSDETGYKALSVEVDEAYWRDLAPALARGPAPATSRFQKKNVSASRRITAVGHVMSWVQRGQTVSFKGKWTCHQTYGMQVAVEAVTELKPTTAEGLESLLCGTINGVGPVTAKAMVDMYGDKIEAVLDDPLAVMKLMKVKGIGKVTAQKIKESWDISREKRSSVVFLQSLGLKPAMAQRVFDAYGSMSEQILKEDPYAALITLSGSSFRQAELVAEQLGSDSTLPSRGGAAMLQVLVSYADSHGHAYLTWDELCTRALELLTSGQPWPHEQRLEASATFMMSKGLMVLECESPEAGLQQVPAGAPSWPPNTRCYASALYQAEVDIADTMTRLASKIQKLPASGAASTSTSTSYDASATSSMTVEGSSTVSGSAMVTSIPRDVEQLIDRLERSMAGGATFTVAQRIAVANAATAPVMLLTGDAGCGKTLTTKAIVHMWLQQSKRVGMCAPTGRAAQRLQEVVNAPKLVAKTIHRLLGYKAQGLPQSATSNDASSGATSGEDDDGLYNGTEDQFEFSGGNPLPFDAVLVDEASMLDITVAAALMRALPRHGCQLVLVGDPNQLPPVGAGHVLRSLLAIPLLPRVHLGEVFRQEGASNIVQAALQVMKGQYPSTMLRTSVPDLLSSLGAAEGLQVHHLKEELGSDAVLVEVHDGSSAEELTAIVVKLVARISSCGINVHSDLQVLSPTKKSGAGTFPLNVALQPVMNPRGAAASTSASHKAAAFHVGDRVVQVINNYDKEVYNGDLGIVFKVLNHGLEIEVEYPARPGCAGPHLVKYTGQGRSELQLAWATTVHKAQGGEYPVVVLPLHHVGAGYLLNRQMLYTAVTRAKAALVVVATRRALERCLSQQSERPRASHLLPRIKAKLVEMGVMDARAQPSHAGAPSQSVPSLAQTAHSSSDSGNADNAGRGVLLKQPTLPLPAPNVNPQFQPWQQKQQRWFDRLSPNPYNNSQNFPSPMVRQEQTPQDLGAAISSAEIMHPGSQLQQQQPPGSLQPSTTTQPSHARRTASSAVSTANLRVGLRNARLTHTLAPWQQQQQQRPQRQPQQ